MKGEVGERKGREVGKEGGGDGRHVEIGSMRCHW